MTAELDRLRGLLVSANDKSSIEFPIARTYAAGGEYREAINRLRNLIDLNLGFDPSRDRLFARLRGTKEFQALEKEVRIQTPRVFSSHLAAVLSETNLSPENLAYDPGTKTFFLGSTSKNEIVRCYRGGACEPFVAPHREGLGYVLGLKIDPTSRTLWATSNAENGASLREYNLASGKLIHNYALPGSHRFNSTFQIAKSTKKRGPA